MLLSGYNLVGFCLFVSFLFEVVVLFFLYRIGCIGSTKNFEFLGVGSIPIVLEIRGFKPL